MSDAPDGAGDKRALLLEIVRLHVNMSVASLHKDKMKKELRARDMMLRGAVNQAALAMLMLGGPSWRLILPNDCGHLLIQDYIFVHVFFYR